MSDAKHTRGPWGVKPVGYGVSIEPDLAWVGYGSAHDKDIHDANARLIAAAPELLEALELADECGQATGADSSYPEAWESIRAAIAKAKGEQL